MPPPFVERGQNISAMLDGPNRVAAAEDPQPHPQDLKESDPVAYMQILINKIHQENDMISQRNVITEFFLYILRKQEYILQRFTATQYTTFAVTACDRCEVFLVHPTTADDISYQNLLQQVIAAYSD